MGTTQELKELTDDELIRRLSNLLQQSRRTEMELVAHIGEMDERRLFARECSSMFAYCVEVLHLSEPEAYLRIGVARAARKFPLLLTMLGDGRLHLSGIALLAPHLTEENCESLLARAAHRSKRQIEELIAELSPKPDAPARIRKLPPPPRAPQGELRPERVAVSAPPKPAEESPPAPAAPVSPPPRQQPLSPERFKITFTASRELRDKLERLQALVQEDLAALIEAAVTEKLERLEAKRYGAVKSPRKTLAETDTSPRSRYIPAAVRREVRKRDGDRCRFVSEHGRRCTEHRALELHHHDPFGRGGDHDPANISLMCRQHNAHLAEREYGRDVMQQYRYNGGRVSETASAYGVIDLRIGARPPKAMTGYGCRRGAERRDRLPALRRGNRTAHPRERSAAAAPRHRKAWVDHIGGKTRVRDSRPTDGAVGGFDLAAHLTED